MIGVSTVRVVDFVVSAGHQFDVALDSRSGPLADLVRGRVLGGRCVFYYPNAAQYRFFRNDRYSLGLWRLVVVRFVGFYYIHVVFVLAAVLGGDSRACEKVRTLICLPEHRVLIWKIYVCY